MLTDLKKSVSTIIKSTVSLAKIIDAEIVIFCVKKPTDVVKKDNQFTAIGDINAEYTTANKKIKAIAKSISNTYNIPVNYSFTVGHLKNEIKQHIKSQQPDVVVIGKRKTKLLNLSGDNLTRFILKQHSGAVMIADQNNTILPENNLNLGVFNDIEQTQNMAFSKPLMAHTQKPIKAFKVVNSVLNKNTTTRRDTVEFIFEQQDNTLKNISNYLLKNKVNLLFINRTKNGLKKEKQRDFNSFINQLNVSLFLSEIKQTQLT